MVLYWHSFRSDRNVTQDYDIYCMVLYWHSFLNWSRHKKVDYEWRASRRWLFFYGLNWLQRIDFDLHWFHLTATIWYIIKKTFWLVILVRKRPLIRLLTTSSIKGDIISLWCYSSNILFTTPLYINFLFIYLTLLLGFTSFSSWRGPL